ncbi:YerC/YecD family TrpR-related protein, partial [Bacillus sp. WP8]|uniref:YerC/YecD family TrpR-related protein n=1 Tax=Bacillus sp. WP8 TaxID=756828 RepID=UPI0011A57553
TLHHLFNSILSLKHLQQSYPFFHHFSTINQIQSLSHPLQVPPILPQPNTYHKIHTQTPPTTPTISPLKPCLNYANDAYTMPLDRVAE